jgi:uncharacterized protein with PQ loop repeat
MYEVIGFVGTFLAVAAYVPQISLLLRRRSASDIDIRSWVIWLIATALILVRALSGDDLVFKMLATSNVAFALIIVSLILTFRERRGIHDFRHRNGRK